MRGHLHIAASLLMILVGLLVLLTWTGNLSFSTTHWIDWLHEREQLLQRFHALHPQLAATAYVLLVTICAVTDLPSASFLAVAGGVVLGFWPALLLFLPAMAVGAMVPFVLSRRYFGPFLEARFPKPLIAIRQGIGDDGVYFLCSLRLIPMMPFVAVNLFMGVTQVRALPFFLVTALARLPATAIYCGAGEQLSKIHSIGELFTAPLLASLAALGCLPLTLRYLQARRRRRRLLPLVDKAVAGESKT